MQLGLIEGRQRDTSTKQAKKNTQFDTEVYQQAQRFIRNNKMNSKNTAYVYEKDIRNFFQRTRGKDIEHLKAEDLIYTMDEIEDYYTGLIDESNVSINTANRYLTSVIEFFKYMRRKKLIEDISFLEIKRFSQETNHYGILSVDEVIEMAERVKYHGKEEVGLVKHYLILFASDTASRLSECLNLKWNNFQKIDEHEYRVTMVGKGNKKIQKIIKKDFYEQLLNIKTGDKVFDIHVNTVNRMMKKLREEMSIPKERNITFHSFKKAAVDFSYKETRDLNQARRVANHSNIATTQVYIDQEEDYGVRGFYSSSFNVDDKLYQKTDVKTLKKAIDLLDKGQQMYINMKINDLKNKSK